MVGFAAPPPSPEEIKQIRIANYNYHKKEAETAELNNDRWAVYTQLRMANRDANLIHELHKYPLLDLTAPLNQFTSVEKLQALCLDYNGSVLTPSDLAAQIKDVLLKAIEDSFKSDSDLFPMVLKPEVKAIDTHRLSMLKTFLLAEINTYTAKKEQALWAALIPGSVVREIIHIPTSNWGMGTSMKRGTFRQVVDALVALQNGKTLQPDCQDANYKAIDASVVAALRQFKSTNPTGFNKFIGKLHTHEHARVLYDALPADLKLPPPGSSVTVVDSRKSVSRSSVSGVLDGKTTNLAFYV